MFPWKSFTFVISRIQCKKKKNLALKLKVKINFSLRVFPSNRKCKIHLRRANFSFHPTYVHMYDPGLVRTKSEKFLAAVLRAWQTIFRDDRGLRSNFVAVASITRRLKRCSVVPGNSLFSIVRTKWIIACPPSPMRWHYGFRASQPVSRTIEQMVHFVIVVDALVFTRRKTSGARARREQFPLIFPALESSRAVGASRVLCKSTPGPSKRAHADQHAAACVRVTPIIVADFHEIHDEVV